MCTVVLQGLAILPAPQIVYLKVLIQMHDVILLSLL